MAYYYTKRDRERASDLFANRAQVLRGYLLLRHSFQLLVLRCSRKSSNKSTHKKCAHGHCSLWRSREDITTRLFQLKPNLDVILENLLGKKQQIFFRNAHTLSLAFLDCATTIITTGDICTCAGSFSHTKKPNSLKS